MSNYQGHLPDGSSIQAHSAGGAYPYVLQLRDHPRGGYLWECIGPGVDGALRFASYDEWDRAVRRLLAVTSNEDAWAFELEALQHCAGQRQTAMQSAAGVWQGPADWARMTRDARVRSLLLLGRVRNTLRLPMVNVPTFAALAAAEVA
jgi:hypothetical protein